MALATTPTEDDTIMAIVTQIAAAEDTAVTDLPPLYDALDTESLHSLLESDGVTVSFTYCGYRVTAASDEDITIRDVEDSKEDA